MHEADRLIRFKERLEETDSHLIRLLVLLRLDGEDFLIIGIKAIVPVKARVGFIMVVMFCEVDDGPAACAGVVECFPLLFAVSGMVAVTITCRPLVPDLAGQTLCFESHSHLNPFLVITERRIKSS